MTDGWLGRQTLAKVKFFSIWALGNKAIKYVIIQSILKFMNILL